MQWVAKVAAAERDYRAALDHMERPGAAAEQSETAAWFKGPGRSGAMADLTCISMPIPVVDGCSLRVLLHVLVHVIPLTQLARGWHNAAWCTKVTLDVISAHSVLCLCLPGGAAPSSSSAPAASEEVELWYLDAIDLILQNSDDYGERAASAIRDQLSVIDE